jgi:hypothetical protein
VIFPFLDSPVEGSNLLCAFLPLAIAGCTTVAILVLHWFAGLICDGDQIPKQHPCIPKGASQ